MNKSIGKQLLAVVLVCLAGLGVFLATQGERPEPHASDQESGLPTSPPNQSQAEGEDGGNEEPAAVVPAEAAEDLDEPPVAAPQDAGTQDTQGAAREAIQPAAFSALLVDGSDLGIAGARLSWTSYPVELVEESGWRDLGPWRISDTWFVEHTVWTDSDLSGAFSFPQMPAGQEGDVSVIWVTHPGFQAVPILLGDDPEAWPADMEQVMELSPGIRVRVVDGEGQGIQDATVDEFALLPKFKILLVPLEAKDVARLFLRRSFVTDQGGYASLPPFPGKLSLQAGGEGIISSVWKGRVKAEVELRLGPSFTAEGRLILASGDEHYPGELTVIIEGWTKGLQRRIIQVPFDDATLTWGPVQVPLSGEDQFSFNLTTAKIAPRSVSISPPASREHVVIDFESTVGEEVWFHLTNRAGETLKEGKVELFMDGADEYGTVAQWVREDGYIRFVGCPKGHINTIRASSPGHVTLTSEGFEVPEKEPILHAFSLLQAGRIAGRCLTKGAPVRDFEVIVWPTENLSNTLRKQVSGSEDGSFEMDRVPYGELQILAVSDLHAPSRPQSITLAPDETAEVELSLQDARSGEGSVVDGSGDPLPSASIQLLHNNGRKTTAEWGRPIQVDSEGRFRLGNLPPDDVSFVVSAPGFSSAERWGGGQGERELDFGVTCLTPLRELELRFLFPEGVDPTQYLVSFGLLSTGQALSSAGTFKLESASVPLGGAWLQTPDGSFLGLKVPNPTGRD